MNPPAGEAEIQINEKQRGPGASSIERAFYPSRASGRVHSTAEAHVHVCFPCAVPLRAFDARILGWLEVPDGSRANPGAGAAHQGRGFSNLALSQGGCIGAHPCPVLPATTTTTVLAGGGRHIRYMYGCTSRPGRSS